MTVDISVVIPFFNPGPNIDDCIASLIGQSLSPARFEVVLVDDGSTDGSLSRVREWARQHPELLKVHHLPASGWPGRPRNHGVDQASGRFVHFVDSDDSLAPAALERMLAIADESDADVVVGKMSSDFRGLHHPLFRRTVIRRTINDYPLAQNLTVAKMFRRDFLIAHNVRFAEGPHHVEDQHICMQAYSHARSVAVVGDLACYFYRRRRTAGRNLGDTAMVPSDYYRDLAAVLDVTDTQISAATTRQLVLRRFYRTEMLGRLRGRAMLDYDADYRLELFRQVRALATSRFPPEVHDSLPAFIRTQSRLLLNDDLAGLSEYARRLDSLRLRATAAAPTWRAGHLVVDVAARLFTDDEPFRLEAEGRGWLLPQSIAPGVGQADRRFSPDDDVDLDLDLATVSRADSQLWSTTAGLSIEIDADGCPTVRGEVAIDPQTVMGGTALTAGSWDLRLRVILGGLSRASALRPAATGISPATSWLSTDHDGPRTVTALWEGGNVKLALDVDGWSHSLHDLIADRLVSDAQAAPVTIDRERRLVIPAYDVRGVDGESRGVSLILEPLDSPLSGVVTCGGELRPTEMGSTIEVEVGPLPTGRSRWALWLRIGPVGGAPPRRLPVELMQTRTRKLRLTPAVA
jgi:glycosyltransferase involved in cell wall biosynthesis